MIVKETRLSLRHKARKAGRAIERVLDPFIGYRLHRASVRRRIGYWPNIKKPSSFNEKILYRKLFDRNPLFPVITDKVRVKKFLAGVLGRDRAAELTIPTYHVISAADDLPFDDLPDEYVVKPSHLSGNVAIITREHPIEKERMYELSRRWLRMQHGKYDNQWAYRSANRAIIVEKLIRTDGGEMPPDYKFFVFHGVVRMIQLDHDRFSAHSRTLFTPEWSPLNVTYHKPRGPVLQKPKRLDDMIALSEELGRRFDFLRVDLYAAGDSIYVGELTLYPESGKGCFVPTRFDYELGQYW